MVVKRFKRLKSSPYAKYVADSGSSKVKGGKVMIDVDKAILSPFALPNDELQSFPSKGRALISSIMDIVVGKSFSKPLPWSPLKMLFVLVFIFLLFLYLSSFLYLRCISSSFCIGYDAQVDNPFVIRHSSITRETSKSLLLARDEKLLSDFPLEALHDIVVYNVITIQTSILCCDFIHLLSP